MRPASPSVAVVGGGITGLVAAYRLRQALGPDATITLVEAADRLGGSLRTVELAGDPVDVGAEAFVVRRPEMPALLSELGLDDQLVHPSSLRPLVWAAGTARPLPTGTLMGVPAGPDSLRDLVDDATLTRMADEPAIPLAWNPGDDVDIATLVGQRFGDQVVQRSVDPLLGGVYAGVSSAIGVRAALPTLAAALDEGASSLTEAVRTALPEPSSGPVFGGLRDGYRVLLDSLRARAAATAVTARVAGLRREVNGWSLDPIGRFDRVVLAVPAPQAATLLREVAPDAADAAAQIPLSSSALVALALPADTPLPQHSGILVATGESLRAKAFTFSSRKWPHLAGRGVALVRASFGRFGDDAPPQYTDAELVTAAVEDLAAITGDAVEPTDACVQRWPAGLPQYLPGHVDRVRTIERAMAQLDGIEVAGGYLHGVGVPACVASGTAAAQHLVAR